MRENPAKLKVGIDNFHDAVSAIQRYGDGGRIGHNTRIVEVQNAEGQRGVGIKLHRTVIVAYFPDGIRLDSGGYETVTTKARMNTVLPPFIRVVQRKHKWLITINRGGGMWTEHHFYDGVTIPVDPATYLPNPMVRPTAKQMGSFKGHDLKEAQAVWARGMSKSAPPDPRAEFLAEVERERAGNIVDVRGDYLRATRAPVADSPIFRKRREDLESDVASGVISIRDVWGEPGYRQWAEAGGATRAVPGGGVFVRSRRRRFGRNPGRAPVFYNDQDDVRWLKETHLPGVRGVKPFKSFVLFGNEDWPERIDLYRSRSPLVTDKPQTFVDQSQDGEGGKPYYVESHSLPDYND